MRKCAKIGRTIAGSQNLLPLTLVTDSDAAECVLATLSKSHPVETVVGMVNKLQLPYKTTMGKMGTSSPKKRSGCEWGIEK